MLKRSLVTAALVVAAVTAVPAGAQASASGAERAVKRELRFDYGDIYHIDAACQRRARGYYRCEFTFDAYQWCGHDSWTTVSGRARVWQRGRRYSVDYRVNC